MRSRVIIRSQNYKRKYIKGKSKTKTLANSSCKEIETVEDKTVETITNFDTYSIAKNEQIPESPHLIALQSPTAIRSPRYSQNSPETYILSRENLNYLASNLKINSSVLWNSIVDITGSSYNVMSLTPSSSKSSKVLTQDSIKTNYSNDKSPILINNTQLNVDIKPNSNEQILNLSSKNNEQVESLSKNSSLQSNKSLHSKQAENSIVPEHLVVSDLNLNDKILDASISIEKSSITERSLTFESDESLVDENKANAIESVNIELLKNSQIISQQNKQPEYIVSPEITFGSELTEITEPSLHKSPKNLVKSVKPDIHQPVQSVLSTRNFNSSQLTCNFEIKEASDADILNRLRGIFDVDSGYSTVCKSPDLFSDEQLSLE